MSEYCPKSPSKRGHDHPSIECSSLHIAEDLVDVLELHLVIMGMDLSLGGELDGFREILTAAHDRTTDRDATQNDSVWASRTRLAAGRLRRPCPCAAPCGSPGRKPPATQPSPARHVHPRPCVGRSARLHRATSRSPPLRHRTRGQARACSRSRRLQRRAGPSPWHILWPAAPALRRRRSRSTRPAWPRSP